MAIQTRHRLRSPGTINNTRLVLATVSALCVIAVGFALFAQHRMHMEPCPWCILQRVLYVLIAFVAGLGALFGGERFTKVSSAGAVIISITGVVAAWYQHAVAAKSSSCAFTLADRIISGLHLDTLWPAMFEVRANCADGAVNLVGVPFEFWSLALFALLALVTAWTTVREHA